MHFSHLFDASKNVIKNNPILFKNEGEKEKEKNCNRYEKESFVEKFITKTYVE